MVDHNDPSSPPIAFPVYGLDALWLGERWFNYHQGRNGDRAWAVGLGHRAADGTGGIIVSTLRRSHYDAARTDDPLVEIALDGAIRLGNAMLPGVDVPRPQGLLKALVDHMQHQSGHYRDWAVARWQVDGSPVTGPILNFADGWMTFTGAVPDVYLSVLGVNVPATSSLDAISVVDLREYGPNPEAWPSGEVLHPDFLALVP